MMTNSPPATDAMMMIVVSESTGTACSVKIQHAVMMHNVEREREGGRGREREREREYLSISISG